MNRVEQIFFNIPKRIWLKINPFRRNPFSKHNIKKNKYNTKKINRENNEIR